MYFLNAVADATLTDAAQLISEASKDTSISMKEALSTSVTGIAVVMIILALLAVLVVILSKLIRAVESASKKKENKSAVAAPVSGKKAESKGTALPDTQSAGDLELYKTDEKTAAVIMAIVSNESGIPLNRLQFNSIKLIEK